MFANKFFELKDRNLVLYGASYFGDRCYNYAKEIGFDDGQIICFIDRNTERQRHDFCGKKVYDISYLQDKPDLVIVICSEQRVSVFNDIRNARLSNPVFDFLDFSPAYPSGFNCNIEDVKSLYEDDDYTDDIINAVFHIRNRNNCRIQPVEAAMAFNVYGNGKYWSDNNIPRLFHEELTFCDAGAFAGDSLKCIYKEYGERIKKYYAFEPDFENYKKLSSMAELLKTGDKAVLFQCELSNANETQHFASTGSMSHIIDEFPAGDTENNCAGGMSISLKRLDDLNITPVGKLCIKMDIEGSELKALEGAKETIKSFAPELAICVYHLADDIFEIPRYIKSVNPGYKCVIRGGTHMVCYASCNE
jgi:FkbM family methyltransferase